MDYKGILADILLVLLLIAILAVGIGFTAAILIAEIAWPAKVGILGAGWGLIAVIGLGVSNE